MAHDYSTCCGSITGVVVWLGACFYISGEKDIRLIHGGLRRFPSEAEGLTYKYNSTLKTSTLSWKLYNWQLTQTGVKQMKRDMKWMFICFLCSFLNKCKHYNTSLYPIPVLPECPPAALACAGGYSPTLAAPLGWGRLALARHQREDEGLEQRHSKYNTL